MLGFAEFGRDMIVQRTQEGKAIARSKGIRVDGRPEKVIPAEEFEMYLKMQKEGQLTVKLRRITGEQVQDRIVKHALCDEVLV